MLAFVFFKSFPTLGISDHLVVSVSIDLLSYSQSDAQFHCIDSDYSHAESDGLHDHDHQHLKNQCFCCAASEFCELSSHRLVISVKGFLKLPNLDMLIKQKSPSLSRNLVPWTFSELPVVFSTKVNLLYLLYSTNQSCYLLHLIKQNCLLKAFMKTLILMTQVSLYLFFPSRTNLKLHNISVTPKTVKKVTINLDLSKICGPGFIPVVVLKNCEPELSFIPAELFNKCLKESCSLDCWKVSSVVPVFKNVGVRSTAKNYCPVSVFSVVSKVFEKLVNNRIVDQLEKCGLRSS